MPVNGTVEITGLSHEEADEGVPINSMTLISGTMPAPVTDFSIIWSGQDLPPNNVTIGLQGFPWSFGGKSATGTDSNGAIGAVGSFTIQPGEDNIYDLSGGGSVELEDGFAQQEARVFISDITGTRSIRIDMLGLDVNDPGDWPGSDPPADPSDLTADEITEESVLLSWTNNGDDPTGFIIVRDDEGVASVPATKTTYRDRVTSPAGTKNYKVIAYKGTSKSGSSNTLPVTFTGAPDVNVVGSGGMVFDGVATVVLISDPSGLYTLVEGKRHDTLYNRAGDPFIDVKIPNPFGKTGFVGE